MKKFIYSIFTLIFCEAVYAQVAIGNGSQPVTAALGVLDLSNETRPLILPNVDSKPADAVEGTMIFDSSTKKVEYKKDTGWEELTRNAGVRNTVSASFVGATESRGVIIGSDTSLAPGVLVLEKSDAGLVLSRTNDPQNISKPTSGSVIFDESKKMLAFYNGVEWSFWEVPLVITVFKTTASTGSAINQNASVSYTGGKGTSYPAGNLTQNGITITYPAGTLGASGTIDVRISGTPLAPGTVIFNINEGNQAFDLIEITVG